MVKKWAISDEPPRKVRLVQERESCQDAESLINRTPRVRAIGRRIVKMLLALWMLSVGAWLQANHGNKTIASTDGPHEAIGDDTINLL